MKGGKGGGSLSEDEIKAGVKEMNEKAEYDRSGEYNVCVCVHTCAVMSMCVIAWAFMCTVLFHNQAQLFYKLILSCKLIV